MIVAFSRSLMLSWKGGARSCFHTATLRLTTAPACSVAIATRCVSMTVFPKAIHLPVGVLAFMDVAIPVYVMRGSRKYIQYTKERKTRVASGTLSLT